MNKYPEQLKLENQICFPLYVASKEIVRKYQPILEKYEITYTQYLVLMDLWEYGPQSVKEIGDRLYLDSGTLTPLLKKLEKKNLLTRSRDKKDERSIVIKLTSKGEKFKEEALNIPLEVAQCVKLSPEEAKTLHSLLYKTIGGLTNE